MHEHEPLSNPSLTIALALLVGALSNVVAHHIRMPGIVLLLAAGVLLGPDFANVIQPAALGSSLSAIVGFAVAIILFEGGMNLDIPRLRRTSGPIRGLITVGAVVTFVGATLAVRALLQWSWTLSMLFGTLVIVTGPTVITPLLRRLRVQKNVSTILEAEGVLIDPIGAIAAFVALEIALEPTALEIAKGFPNLLLRLTVGGLLGALAAWMLSRLLKVRNLVPEGLTNVFTLAWVLALYQCSEAIWHESGIAAVTLAGVATRYLGTPVERELLEFKEQLTVMLIGMLFVLLAADVRVQQVVDLGVAGVGVVLALMFVVRPLNVLAGTFRTGLTWQEQAFMSWIGPRGIVAAGVASLFAARLAEKLRALVFLVIAVTVVVAGLTGGLVAQALGLRRPVDAGFVILGAHGLARKLAQLLAAGGHETLLIDVNPDHCRAAEEAGLRVIQGNALKDTTLGRAELDTRLGVIGVTANEEVNFLFAQKARQQGKVRRLYAALSNRRTGVTDEMLHHEGAEALFGIGMDVERWTHRVEADIARIDRRIYRPPKDGERFDTAEAVTFDGNLLPMVVLRNGVALPVGDGSRFRKRDEVVFLVPRAQEEQWDARLRAAGWLPVGAGSTVPDTEETPVEPPGDAAAPAGRAS